MATTSISPSNLDQAALQVGRNYDQTQDALMSAYALKEGASKSQMESVAKKLGAPTTNLTVEGLQLLAKERFERSTQILGLFSSLLDRMSTIKDQIIRNIGR